MKSRIVHRAMKRNNRQLVELLLKYVAENTFDTLGHKVKTLVDEENKGFLFRPDFAGSAS